MSHKQYTRVGDLVSVTEERGCGKSTKVALGLGVVLDIQSTEDLMFGSVGPINLGDQLTVRLQSGETKVFCQRSLEVVSASR